MKKIILILLVALFSSQLKSQNGQYCLTWSPDPITVCKNDTVNIRFSNCWKYSIYDQNGNVSSASFGNNATNVGSILYTFTATLPVGIYSLQVEYGCKNNELDTFTLYVPINIIQCNVTSIKEYEYGPIITIEYYTLYGNKISIPESNTIYIKKEIYQNGYTKTTKILY